MPLTASNVQYNVPDPKFVVFTVKLTVTPSFADVVLGDIEKVPP